MAVTIAACRTLTAARPLALASRVSWFRFRAMPLSWAMKSSCSRVIRALTVPRSISWRRTSAGGCPASRQRAENRSFRSGLSRVLTTYLQMRPMPTFGRPPCLLYVFFGVSMTGCFDRLFMLYRLFRPAGFYAGQRGRRSFRLRKHNLAFLNLYPFPTRWFNFLRFRFQGLQIIPTKVTLPVGCRFREIRPVFYMGDQIVIYVLVKLLWSITSLRGQRRIRSEVVLRPASSLSKKA